MKNALILLLCTVILGCIGGRKVHTTVQHAELLKPVQLTNSGLAIKPIQLAPAVPRPVAFKPVRKGPDVVIESVDANPIPLAPPAAAGENTPFEPTVSEITPIEIRPIDIKPIPPATVEVLPELEVETLVLKEIELPKPVHVKMFHLVVYYILAALLIWLSFKGWQKYKKKAPAKRSRKKRS
jgi:hypothetical protein